MKNILCRERPQNYNYASLRVREKNDEAIVEGGVARNNGELSSEKENQIIVHNGIEEWEKEAMPLEILTGGANETVSLWFYHNVLNMNKLYVVEFQGCEWEALNLFMKIDKRRQERGLKTPSIVVVIKVQRC